MAAGNVVALARVFRRPTEPTLVHVRQAGVPDYTVMRRGDVGAHLAAAGYRRMIDNPTVWVLG